MYEVRGRHELQALIARDDHAAFERVRMAARAEFAQAKWFCKPYVIRALGKLGRPDTRRQAAVSVLLDGMARTLTDSRVTRWRHARDATLAGMGDELSACKRLVAVIVVVLAMWIDHDSPEEPGAGTSTSRPRVLRPWSQDPWDALMLRPPDAPGPRRRSCYRPQR